MNMTNLLLQMTYAAMETTQNTLNELPAKTEDGKDFETMLKDKTEQPAENTTEKPAATEDTDKAENPATDVEMVQQVLNQTGGIQNAAVLNLLVAQPETSAEAVAMTDGMTAVMEPEQQTTSQLPVMEETVAEELPVEATTETAEEAPVMNQPVVEAPKADAKATVATAEVPTEVTEETPEAATVEGKTITVSETEEDTALKQETGTDHPSHEVEILETASAPKSEPLFKHTEAMPQKVGDSPVLDTKSPEFDKNLTKETMSAFEAGKDSVTMKLTPDHLGEVVVKLQTDNTGILHVVIHAESDEAATLLKEHSGSLVSLLQNSRSGEVQLEIPQPKENENAFHHGQEDGSRGNQQQQQSRRERETDSEQFMQQLRLGLVTGE